MNREQMKQAMAERQAEVEEIEVLIEMGKPDWLEEEVRVLEWWEDPEWERRFERG